MDETNNNPLDSFGISQNFEEEKQENEQEEDQASAQDSDAIATVTNTLVGTDTIEQEEMDLAMPLPEDEASVLEEDVSFSESAEHNEPTPIAEEDLTLDQDSQSAETNAPADLAFPHEPNQTDQDQSATEADVTPPAATSLSPDSTAEPPMNTSFIEGDENDNWLSDKAANFFTVLCYQENEDAISSLFSVLENAKIDLDFEPLRKQAQTGNVQLTRVNEYTATFVAAQCHQLGIPCDVTIPALATSAPLDQRREHPEGHYTTGGYKLKFPKDFSDMNLSTGDTVPGHSAVRTKGIVTANKAMDRHFFKETENNLFLQEELARLKNDARDKTKKPSSATDRVFQDLFWKLQNQAIRLGANGVISIRMSCFAEQKHFDDEADQIRVILTGTAVELVECDKQQA